VLLAPRTIALPHFTLTYQTQPLAPKHIQVYPKKLSGATLSLNWCKSLDAEVYPKDPAVLPSCYLLAITVIRQVNTFHPFLADNIRQTFTNTTHSKHCCRSDILSMSNPSPLLSPPFVLSLFPLTSPSICLLLFCLCVSYWFGGS
jgi:hypothetical protein